jgi:hypothetical protein
VHFCRSFFGRGEIESFARDGDDVIRQSFVFADFDFSARRFAIGGLGFFVARLF